MTRGIDDGVMPLVSEELLGGAGNGHSTLALLLLSVHVKGEGEGGLAKVGGLLLELLELTLRDTCRQTNACEQRDAYFSVILPHCGTCLSLVSL